MDGAAVVTLLTSVTGAGVIAAVVNGLINRRKLGADTTKVITEAAASLVGMTQGRLDTLEKEMTEVRKALRIHEPWDREAVKKLRSADPPIDILDPPPLYPDASLY